MTVDAKPPARKPRSAKIVSEDKTKAKATRQVTRKTGVVRKVAKSEPSSDLVVVPHGGVRVAGPRARQIYVHASRLFVEKGYAATSMSDIAEAVKITKAGLYHFVKGKEELLFTIMSFGLDELFDEVVKPARATAEPAERLRLILTNHLTNIGRVSSRSGNPVTIVVDEPGGLGPKKRRIINARKREYFELIRDTLNDLKARGDTRPDLDTTIATHCMIGSILWMARWRKPNGKLSLDQIIDQIIALQLGGILRPGIGRLA